MIIDYSELIDTINNYWTSSETLSNIIDTLDFSNVKSNIDIKQDVMSLLKSKLKKVKYYEDLTDEDLYNMIVNNQISFANDKFNSFFKNILDSKFPQNCAVVLKRYIDELQKIQILKEEVEKEDNIIYKLENNVKDETDYLAIYKISDKIIKLYRRELINTILRDYHNGATYRELLKKYHPDLHQNLDNEYMQIINALRKDGMFNGK